MPESVTCCGTATRIIRHTQRRRFRAGREAGRERDADDAVAASRYARAARIGLREVRGIRPGNADACSGDAECGVPGVGQRSGLSHGGRADACAAKLSDVGLKLATGAGGGGAAMMSVYPCWTAAGSP